MIAGRRVPPGRVPSLLGFSALGAWAVARVAAGAALTAMCALLAISMLPVALGWRSTVVLSGSMMPRIAPGDVVASAPYDVRLLQPGQIILVKSPGEPGHLLMHRFVGRDGSGRLITRGDANREADTSPVATDAFVGLPRLRVPWVGLPTLWLREHRTTPIGLLGLLLVLGCMLATGRRPALRHLPR